MDTTFSLHLRQTSLIPVVSEKGGNILFQYFGVISYCHLLTNYFSSLAMERMTTRSHARQLRSSSRPSDKDLRDPATAQNTQMSAASRFRSAFSKK